VSGHSRGNPPWRGVQEEVFSVTISRRGFTIGAAVFLALILASPCHAYWVVTNLADSGPGTLRDAIANANPGLDPLADNGGATQTHALQASSDAIEAIPVGVNGCVAGVSVDQRTCVRAGGAGLGGNPCDIGSFEYGTMPSEIFSDGFESGDSSSWSVTVS
jgi:hypothetical protein